MRWLPLLVFCACGGDGSIAGDPLIQSTVAGEYNNKPWTPVYGFGRTENGTVFAMYVGTGKISCADDFEGPPRDGTYAVTGFSGEPMVGTYDSVSYSLREIRDGDLEGRGSTGTLQITTLTETEVSAVFGFSTTLDNGSYSLTGAVTMLRCP